MKKCPFIAAASLGLLSACDRSPEPPEKTVQQLMAEDVEPNAQVYWKSVQYISDETGDHDIFPRTDAQWEEVRAAAAKLREYGALLQTPGYAEGRGDDWVQFSKSLVEVSERAEQAAQNKSTEEVFAVGGTVFVVCKACHDVYPPAELAAGGAP